MTSAKDNYTISTHNSMAAAPRTLQPHMCQILTYRLSILVLLKHDHVAAFSHMVVWRVCLVASARNTSTDAVISMQASHLRQH